MRVLLFGSVVPTNVPCHARRNHDVPVIGFDRSVGRAFGMPCVPWGVWGRDTHVVVSSLDHRPPYPFLILHSLPAHTWLASKRGYWWRMPRQIQGPLSRPRNQVGVLPCGAFVLASLSLGLVGLVALYHLVQIMVPHQDGRVVQTSPQKLRGLGSDLKDRESDAHADRGGQAAALEETLLLQTKLGDIAIVLRPDLSPESVAYIQSMAMTGDCANCKLYRAEKPGILQGIVANREKVPISKVKGSCPPGFDTVPNDCPRWDKNCACHGPVMTRGMVAWAAGGTGPDFFIDNYRRTADWWGTQHTVWGEVRDAASFAVIDKVWSLPAHHVGGLTMLNEEIHFDLALVGSQHHAAAAI